ncbi:hypothetical protein [Pontibacter beigongshangensis]|uniref:hypothetical protein n=1 Tax=Pontibacter beigongshangensis TaxID=2574733 RepID=UPI0016507433|nr:hypothetical protein [Pontibacter beigongshangensis]
MKFKYPSDKQLVEFETGLRNIVFKQTLTEQIIEANKIVVALLDKMTPYVDILQLHTESIRIPEQMHRQAYPQWEEMPQQYRNKILRARKKAEELDKEGLNMLVEVLNSQAQQMADWDDRLFARLEELQEKLEEAA